MKEKVTISGDVKIVLKDNQGKIKKELEVKNLIVTAGKNWQASFIGAETPPDNMGYMAIGTGTTEPDATDTGLGAEVGVRVTTTKSIDDNKVIYVGTFEAGNPSEGGAITEAGIFNDDSVGTMYCRAVFDTINKGASDTLEITWTITHG